MAAGGKNVMELIIAARDRTQGAFGKVGAQIRSTTGQTGKLNTGMKGLSGSMGNASGMAGKLATAIGPLGIAGVAIAAVAAVGMFAASAVKSFTAFEDSMANVRKTTGMTKEETVDLGHAIDDMALRLPVAHGELAKIAAIAGQLGIQGKTNILGFTEDIAKMSTAFDMSAEDTATAMAKLANIYDIPIEKVSNLGSAINVLGNTTAASESQLMDFSMSLGPTGQQLGFSATQTLALGASMIEMGVNSSDAGTRLNRAFSMIGQNLGELSKFMGVSTAEFTKSFEDMPMETFTQILQKLSEVEGNLEANTIASELFGEIGAKAIKGITGNLDGLQTNLKNSATGYKENTSLTEEFAAKTDTLKAKFTLVGNAAESLKINIGQALAPLAGALAEGISTAIGGLSTAFTSLQKVAAPVINILLLQFRALHAFLIGFFEPVIDALRPLIDIFRDTTGAVGELSGGFKLLSDISTIVINLATKLGGILGGLLGKAITLYIDKLKESIATFTEFYDKLGPIKGIIEGIADKVGTGAKAIGEWADSFEEAAPPAKELAGAVSELTEEAAKLEPVLTESLKTLESRLTGASGNYKTAIGDITKEIDVLKDAWNLASDDQKVSIEKQIEALVGVRDELGDGEEEAAKYFDTLKEGTEEATKKQEEFSVKIGETTVTFKGMAAEVVKNADAYADLQKNAETLLNLDWSVFTKLEAELPNIDVGISDMASAFSGLKCVLEDNIVELESVKQSVMEISEIAAPFLEAGFLDGIKAIGNFAGSLQDAGSAINTFGNLTEVNVEGCINFSSSVYSMVSALGILETQMHDMKPAFADMEAGMKATLEAFVYPESDTAAIEARITEPIRIYQDFLDKHGLSGDWALEALHEQYGPRIPAYVSKDVEKAALEYLGISEDNIAVYEKAAKDYNSAMLDIRGSTRTPGMFYLGREYEMRSILKTSGEDVASYARGVVHSSRAIEIAVNAQVVSLEYWSDQLLKITDALQPYLEFMRVLNELTALSTVSIDDINAGFKAITDTLTNFSSVLGTIDLTPVMEALFGEHEGEGVFSGGAATGFIKLMQTYSPKLKELTTFTDNLSGAISSLIMSFDALSGIEKSVLMDTDALTIIFENIETIIYNLSDQLSSEGGNFAAILTTAFTNLLTAADPLLVWFRKNSVQVTEFNTAMSAFMLTVTHVIDTMQSLKEMSEMVLPPIDELGAGFDKAKEFVDVFDEALMKHIGLTRGDKTYTYDSEGGLIQDYENNVYDLEKLFDNVFTSITRFADDWIRIEKKIGESFEIFEDGISTIVSIISNITSLTKAFADMKDLVIPDVIEIEAALNKIPIAIKAMTEFLGTETWTTISNNIAEFALKWEAVNEGISTSIDSFSHFVGTITKIVSACTEMTRIFTDMGEIIVIKSDEIADALKEIPIVMAEITEYLTTDSFKAIEKGLVDLDTEYKTHAKNLDEIMPSYDSAFDMFNKLTGGVISLSDAFETLKDATIISSIDMDKAMQNIDVFINRFVEALRINMDNLVESLIDLDIEWVKHEEEMGVAMLSYEGSTEAISKLISTILSLHSALEQLSKIGIISEHAFGSGFVSITKTISNFMLALDANVNELMRSMAELRVVWIENEADLVPLMRDFITITRSFASMAVNANIMIKAFAELSENSGSLEKGFSTLIKFIKQVVSNTKEFYTPEAAAQIDQYVKDIGLVIRAFRYLAEQLEKATSDVEKEVNNTINAVSNKVKSLKSIIPNMYGYGTEAIISFARGIHDYKWVLEGVLINVANTIKKYLGVSSPTELGALKDIETWPRNLVKSFASGIKSEMGTLNASFSGMALTAPGGGGGNRTSITFHVTQQITDRASAIVATNDLERMLNRHEVL